MNRIQAIQADACFLPANEGLWRGKIISRYVMKQ